MIKPVGKYSPVRGSGPRPAVHARPATPFILVKRLARMQKLKDWWHKEIKDGGFLHQYVRQEKYQMPDRFRAIARKFVDWKQPTKTDFQLRAAIPARLYHRLRNEDPHFFEDNANLKSLKRDNPDVFVKV